MAEPKLPDPESRPGAFQSRTPNFSQQDQKDQQVQNEQKAQELRAGQTGKMSPDDPRAQAPGHAKEIPIPEKIKFSLSPGEENYLQKLGEAVVDARERYRKIEELIRRGEGDLDKFREERTSAVNDLEHYRQEFNKEINRETNKGLVR